MNIDGAWISSRRLGGVGLIVRDDSGGFLAVKAANFRDTSSPLLGEALAVKSAVIWAIFRGFHNIIFETDSLQIVEALRDPSINLSSIGQIIEDIEALRSSITEVCFTHTHRYANQAAHRLARFG
ncbi:uncharacterized protein [Pyrus communis]|uniref:uncharacterized protein n=1 Tax=Pyrus communis TaxID=23211 RepID=UPI0035BFA716